MQVLVALDLSPVSQALVSYAARLAGRSDGDVIALYVYTAHEAATAWQEAGVPLDRFLDQVRTEIGFLLARADANAGRTRVVVVQGNPAETILEHARAGVDLIVMGTHGRTGVPRLLLGSVAEAVLRRAPCPVVVVPYTILARAKRQAAASAGS